MKRNVGFTLIELMVVVAVIAIIAAIALPNYRDQVRKSRRAQAREAIVYVQTQQERFRTNNPAFTTDTSAPPAGIGSLPTTDFYTITISSASATGYTLVATAKGDQANDSACTPMQLVANASVITKTPAGCW